ncbi:MAG: aldo/keto reductase [Terriglobia bacterium]|jgi:aryl-alcohol dehydrogenase-like predicted oxidoreductase
MVAVDDCSTKSEPSTKGRFVTASFGSLQRQVHRLGFSASYRPGKAAVKRALDAGIDVFFCYGFDRQMTGVLRDLPPSQRRQLVYVTGAYNLLWWHPNLRRSLEKRLRQLRTDYIDCFLFLGVMGKEKFLDGVLEELQRFREEGKVLSTGVSIHARKLAGSLAGRGTIQALMMRYNAAHRGAEQDIFPHLAAHNPAVISYTATRWRYLLRRPRGWPKDARIPTPALCYRFVLSNPNVHVCLTAPKSARELDENLAALRDGPLSETDLQFMRDFGDAVHAQKKWFM